MYFSRFKIRKVLFDCKSKAVEEKPFCEWLEGKGSVEFESD